MKGAPRVRDSAVAAAGGLTPRRGRGTVRLAYAAVSGREPTMLSSTSYAQGYVASARTALRSTVTAYRKLAKTGTPDATFERQFFNHMVLALEMYFVHRMRAQEGTDGNPLNEVRVLAASIMDNDGRLVSDAQITLSPQRSILGYAVGDEIVLDPDSFTRLSEAFLDEIERRYR